MSSSFVEDSTCVHNKKRMRRSAELVFGRDNYSGASHFEIPYGFTSIGEDAFYSERSFNLKSVVIPSSVTSIEHGAFKSCRNLKSVDMPPSVTKIGAWAFDGCESLKTIALPERVTEIGEGAFWACEALTSIRISDLIEVIQCKTFEFCRGLTSVTLPARLREIEWSAFSNCEKLKSITLPDSVTDIGEYAFQCCRSLETFTFPIHLVSIEPNVFENCDELNTLVFKQRFDELQKKKSWAGVIFPRDSWITRVVVRPIDVGAFTAFIAMISPPDYTDEERPQVGRDDNELYKSLVCCI